MSGPEVDYRAVFQALPGMVALLTPDLVFVDVSEEFVRLSGRRREELVGRYLFAVFPDNPHDPAATGARNLEASLRRVLETGERDTMALQRYDVQSPERPGQWDERYWSPVNTPVLGADGSVALVVHRVEEVTELIRARGRAGADVERARVLESELYTRSRELQEVNERLRQAHAQERLVALALQDAMLPAPRLADPDRAAVRYRPAVGALNVCGDWFDLVELPDDRMVVAVGDVAGHGLIAAGVMGQLRSALSAAARVSTGPAQSLEALGLYSRSVGGAEFTTAVCAEIDWLTSCLTYSSAGHPPPALVRGDGTVVFLDQATDPPLGARPEHGARPEARLAFTGGDTLVLYTDGLIERRREDIDAGLDRLTASLAAHRALPPEKMADALLHDLLPDAGATDDTALVVIRL
ncbi:MAG TPA: SpoIIE family protein phosphatase [Actinospica sp.]|nr:SpoIIE family protein phosphatase [Actinospica sp.]